MKMDPQWTRVTYGLVTSKANELKNKRKLRIIELFINHFVNLLFALNDVSTLLKLCHFFTICWPENNSVLDENNVNTKIPVENEKLMVKR